MSKKADSDIWYGELRASRGNVFVIRGNQLPQANKGRIYLYNTERDAIIEYDEAIVSPKLFELDAEQQKQVEAQYKTAWEAARQQMMKSHGKTVKEQAKPTVKTDDLLPSDDDVIDDDDE